MSQNFQESSLARAIRNVLNESNTYMDEAENVDKFGNPTTTIDPNHPSYKAGQKFGKSQKKTQASKTYDGIRSNVHQASVNHIKDTNERRSTLANKLHMQRQFKAGAHAALGLKEESSKELQAKNFEEKCDYCGKIHAVGPCPAMQESEWAGTSPATPEPYECGGEWGEGPVVNAKDILKKNHQEKGEPVGECEKCEMDESEIQEDDRICFCGHSASSHNSNGCKTCKREGHVAPARAAHAFKLNSTVRMESVLHEDGHELFYGTGGHGGPYPSHEAAAKRAAQMLRGSRSETTIHIKPRTKEGVGGYGDKVGTVSKDREGNITHHHIGNGTWNKMEESVDPILQASMEWLATRFNTKGITEAAMPKPELRVRDKFGNHSESVQLTEETHETQDDSHKRTAYNKTLADNGYKYHHTDQGEFGKWHHYTNAAGDTARTFHHQGGHHAYHLKKKDESKNWMEGQGKKSLHHWLNRFKD